MDDAPAIPGPTLADAFAEIAALRADRARDREKIDWLERIVRAADYALMARLVDEGRKRPQFSVEALMIAAEAEREAGSTLLADAIDKAVGRGPGQPIRLGRWLGARDADPIDGVRVRKVGETVDHAGLYELAEA